MCREEEAEHAWYCADTMQLHSGELHVVKMMLAKFKSGILKVAVLGGSKEVGACAGTDLYQVAAHRNWAKDTWKAHSQVRAIVGF